jgi:hypothetical protein
VQIPFRDKAGSPNEIKRKTKTQVGDNIKMDLFELEWGGVDWI